MFEDLVDLRRVTDPAAVEKWERKMWKRGDDMEMKLLEKMDIETPCLLGGIL